MPLIIGECSAGRRKVHAVVIAAIDKDRGRGAGGIQIQSSRKVAGRVGTVTPLAYYFHQIEIRALRFHPRGISKLLIDSGIASRDGSATAIKTLSSVYLTQHRGDSAGWRTIAGARGVDCRTVR